MTFPTTGILDNFDRGFEGPPPSADWTDSWLLNSGVLVAFDQLTTTFGGDSYWSSSTFGPDCEAFLSIANLVGFALGLRLTTPSGSSDSSTTDGYMASWDGGGNAWLSRIDNAVETVLGATYASSPTSGFDQAGADAVGSTISAYENLSGAGWTTLATRSDSTYSGAGYLGVYIANGGGAFDDFGGGTSSGVSPQNVNVAGRTLQISYGSVAPAGVSTAPPPSLPLSLTLRRLGHVPMPPRWSDPAPQPLPVTDAPDTTRPIVMGLSPVRGRLPITAPGAPLETAAAIPGQNVAVDGRTLQISYGTVAAAGPAGDDAQNRPLLIGLGLRRGSRMPIRPGPPPETVVTATNQNVDVTGRTLQITYGVVTPVPGGVSPGPAGRTLQISYGAVTPSPGGVTTNVTGRLLQISYGAVTATGPAGDDTHKPLLVTLARGSRLPLLPGPPQETAVSATGQNVNVTGRTLQVSYGAVSPVVGAVTVTPAGRTLQITYGAPAITVGGVTVAVTGHTLAITKGAVTATPGNANVAVTGHTLAITKGVVTTIVGATTATPAGRTLQIAYGTVETFGGDAPVFAGRIIIY